MRAPPRVNDQFPELKELQPLPLTELATRLVHLFAKCAREPPAADLGAGAGGAEPVADDLLRELADYLYLADQSYEGATEAQLSRRLQRKGARPACCYAPPLGMLASDPSRVLERASASGTRAHWSAFSREGARAACRGVLAERAYERRLICCVLPAAAAVLRMVTGLPLRPHTLERLCSAAQRGPAQRAGWAPRARPA